MKLVAQYQQFAAECRKLAAQINQPKERQALESMARIWESVAAEREAQLLEQINIRIGLGASHIGGGSPPIANPSWA
jgi:hypothetical protein